MADVAQKQCVRTDLQGTLLNSLGFEIKEESDFTQSHTTSQSFYFSSLFWGFQYMDHENILLDLYLLHFFSPIINYSFIFKFQLFIVSIEKYN